MTGTRSVNSKSMSSTKTSYSTLNANDKIVDNYVKNQIKKELLIEKFKEKLAKNKDAQSE